VSARGRASFNGAALTFVAEVRVRFELVKGHARAVVANPDHLVRRPKIGDAEIDT